MAQMEHIDLETLIESGLEQMPEEEQEQDLPVVNFFCAISFKFVVLALILSCPLLLTPNFPSIESLPYCFVLNIFLNTNCNYWCTLSNPILISELTSEHWK